METERAKAICTTAQTIIDSAREVKYLEVTGQGQEQSKKFFGEDARPIAFPERRALA